ncbi:TPA: peptidoglycan-binding protein LysM [Streptococcus suis]
MRAVNKISGGFSQTNVVESPSFELGYDKILPLETSYQPLKIEVPTIILEEPQIIEVSSNDDLITEEKVLEVEQVDATVETVTEVVTSSTEAAQVHVQVDNQPAQAVTVSTGVAVDDATAKEWIAQKESGGSYTVTNGIYIGRYQLSNAYLNGDHSPENQERVADEYVLQRYGSWSAAYQFWLANGWY